MTDRELMQQALEILEKHVDYYDYEHFTSVCELEPAKDAIIALRERLEQPKFIKHEEGGDGWSDWVCPDPDDYLIKCCDCGLVHEAQFRVVKYAPAPSEECEILNDPNLQAVFRMRRSQRWTPDDTAYRPGGLAHPEQAWITAGPHTAPLRTHWEGCEEVHPECQKPGCAECGKSGGWALYCVACVEKWKE